MNAPQNRATRAQEERQADARDEMKWTPPALLPEPVQDPDYVYRWIRVSLLGSDDPVNINAKRREGFEPVPAEEQPHIAPGTGKFKGAIEVGGLLLCKAPRKMMEQRQAYYENLTKSQQKSVDNDLMKENDARMPLFKEAKSKTSFGKGGE